jgi:invasion protein IalB
LRAWLLALASLALAAPALARQPIGQFGGWAVFRDSAPELVCYVIAEPASSTYPTSAARGAAYVTVSVWPRRNIDGQLFVATGYPLNPTARLNVRSGAVSQRAVARGDGAWASDTSADAQMVAAMRASSRFSFEGLSQRGTRVTDRYDLKGFGAALDAAMAACRG